MSKRMCLSLCVFTLLLSACGEGGKIVYQTELDGYEKKQLRVKLEESLKEIKLPDGSEGYLLTSEVRFSEGGAKRMTTSDKTWMKRNFEFVRRESKITKGDAVESTQEIFRDKGQMVVVDHKEGKENIERVVLDNKEMLVGEIHPLLYSKELDRPGMSKSYWTFFEPMRMAAPTKVRALNKENVKVKDKMIPCMRYTIRSMSNPKEYNEFYISEADKAVVKIKVGLIEFVVPGTKI